MYTYFLFFKKFIEQEPNPNILKKKKKKNPEYVAIKTSPGLKENINATSQLKSGYSLGHHTLSVSLFQSSSIKKFECSCMCVQEKF